MRWSGLLVVPLLGVACASVDPEWEMEEVEEAETGEVDEEVMVGPRCEARLKDESQTAFRDSLTLWLPRGVDTFVEQNPFFATIRGSQPMALCADGSDAGTIQFGAMGYFQDDRDRSIHEVANEAILSIYGGLPVTSNVIELVDEGQSRRIRIELDVPSDPQNGKPEPATALVGLNSGYGRLYWIIYETHPDDWAAVSPALRRSIDSIRLSP